MKRASLILALCLLLTACAAPAAGTEGELAHALGLTQAQRLEDYDCLVQTLKDSYLCLGLHDRENPDDPAEEIFREYREMIEESDSDQAFYSAVYSALWRLGGYGHLGIIEPGDYAELLDWRENQDGHEPWMEVIGASEEHYKTLSAYQELLGDDGGGYGSGGEERENLHTLLLPEAGVAYLKADSFPASYDPQYRKDAEAIRAFYAAAGGCTDLIIDVTENGGGNEGYWQNLLAAPLIDCPLSCVNYALLASSENNRPYIENVFAPEDLHPISELPDLPELNRQGLEAATHFVESTLRVEPAEERAAFHGRVWLLVGPMDPVLTRLPNSGILIQFTMMYGLNPDGSSSEEAGTTPDILSPAGEPALATALRAIREARGR